MICYDINMTPPKFFHSAECRAATHSKVPDLMWMWQFEEKKKAHRLISATPSIQVSEISEWNRHTEVKSTCGVSAYRIQTHVDGVRPTWMGWDPYNPQTLYLGSHIHSLQGDPPDPVPEVTCPQSQGNTPPIRCTWGHRSTVSRVTPLPRPCTWDGKTLG